MSNQQDATRKARTTKTVKLHSPKVIAGVRVTIEPNGKRIGRFRVTVEPAETGDYPATNLDNEIAAINT